MNLGEGTLKDLFSSMVLWNNTLCSLAQPLTPHRFVHLPLFRQCLPRQGKHSRCSFTLTNLSKTDNSLNLGQLCSLWHFPSPNTHGGEVNGDRGIDGHQNFLCRCHLGEFDVSHSMHNPGFLALISNIIGLPTKFHTSYAFWPSRTPHYELSWVLTFSGFYTQLLKLRS